MKRQILYTPKARFAVDSLEDEKRKLLRAINRLRTFNPDHPNGVEKMRRPQPTYVLPTAEGINVYFRLLPEGDVEVIDLIRKEVVEAFRAEAERPA